MKKNKKRIFNVRWDDITPKMRDLKNKLQLNNGNTFLYILIAK